MILLTGAAGFIGFHVAKALLARGEAVLGVDALNDYYDPRLKRARLAQLSAQGGFRFAELDIADAAALSAAIADQRPTKILHLAAQAGVRYSIENPAVYAQANLVGHANILELARRCEVEGMVYASSSSVYGGNAKIPFAESDMTDDPVSFYGATKKSNELLSNSYARLYGIPLTGLRFFTVYGAWGRPDMAYWLFAERILDGRAIRLFNEGRMSRDFTHVSDIAAGVLAALDRPTAPAENGAPPHRIYNLGNDKPAALTDFVDLLEKHLGRPAQRELAPMQNGDVARTWANIDRARAELGYDPKLGLDQGLAEFCAWFQDWRRDT